MRWYVLAIYLKVDALSQVLQAYNVEQNVTNKHGETSVVSRQRDYAQDTASEDRAHRPFAKKRLLPSEPSPHVIFLGLDTDFTEADVGVTLNLPLPTSY